MQVRDQDGAKYWAGQLMGMHFSVRNFGSPLEVGRFLKLIGLGGWAVFYGIDVIPSRFHMHSALNCLAFCLVHNCLPYLFSLRFCLCCLKGWFVNSPKIWFQRFYFGAMCFKSTYKCTGPLTVLLGSMYRTSVFLVLTTAEWVGRLYRQRRICQYNIAWV